MSIRSVKMTFGFKFTTPPCWTLRPNCSTTGMWPRTLRTLLPGTHRGHRVLELATPLTITRLTMLAALPDRKGQVRRP